MSTKHTYRCRQGDLYIQVTYIPELPKDLSSEFKRKSSEVLLEGEVTGHVHKVECVDNTQTFLIDLSLKEGSTLTTLYTDKDLIITHNTHAPIRIPAFENTKTCVQFKRQREIILTNLEQAYNPNNKFDKNVRD